MQMKFVVVFDDEKVDFDFFEDIKIHKREAVTGIKLYI